MGHGDVSLRVQASVPSGTGERMFRVGLNAQLLSLDEGYRRAGLSRFIYNLLSHLPQADGDLSYVAFLGDDRARFPGWQRCVSPLPTANPLVRVLWEQIAQPWAAWREKLDLLHAPAYVGPLAAPCPLVVTVHDLSFYVHPEAFRPLNRLYLQRFTRWSVAQAAAVTADSEGTRNDLVRLLGVPRDKVTVIPPGVGQDMQPLDEDRVKAFRRSHALPERMILYLGTLEPRKNLVCLLEAYALLRARPRFAHRLVVAGGKGWYYDRIYAQVERLGLGGEVLFPGYVPDAELALWYNAADLFVYPSLYEGFGLPPVEAMACGTPVVVSNAPSLPEVVGSAGLAVDPCDVEGLAEAMLKVLNDRRLHQSLREAGLTRARRYSWEATALQMAKLYRRILGDEQTNEP